MFPSKSTLVLASLLLALAPARPTLVKAATAGSGNTITIDATNANQAATPMQRAIQNAIAQRQAQGLAVPSGVWFRNESHLGPGGAGSSDDTAQPVTVVAKTILHFDDPGQAGKPEWPAIEVKGELPAGARGFIKPGDYSPMVKEKLAEQLPGIWDVYQFGHEPRTYTFTETFTIPRSQLTPGPLAPGTTGFDGQFVMGFDIPGPGIDYTLNWSFEVCVPVIGCATVVKFRAGFQMDWALGMRLPMELGVTSETPYLEGSTYFPTSTAKGVDWAAQDYSAAGLPAENGNEFVARLDFTVGVFLEVFGSDVIDYGVDVHPDKSKSFATPFGPGAFFDLPSIDIPLWDEDYSVASLSIGFRLTPQLGSDRFTADWQVTGEASGGGSLTYTDPAVAEVVGPVNAIDGPGLAHFDLDNLRYYFSQFFLDLGIFVHLDVFSVVDETFNIPVTDFDLSSLTGGLYMGVHDGTPGALMGSVLIENVPPTATIDKSAATTINGVPTFLGEIGTPLSFTGVARDPGRDDLTLSWDFADGPPVPDVSTTYPVPHVVSETQTHTFGKACLFSIGFKAVDDDNASGEDHVAVLVLPDTRVQSRLDGYWMTQMAGGADFDAAQLDCLLGIVGHLSLVFDEVRDASTPAKAYDVLNLATNGGSNRDRFDRELLVTWLNLANGAFGYQEMLDTNGDGSLDTPFAGLMAGVEAVRLNPGSTDAAFKDQTDFLHHLNVSRAGKAFAKKVGSGTTPGSSDVPGYFEGLRVARSQGRGVDISFALASPGPAKLEIYDVGGRVIRTFDGSQDAGVHTISWDGVTDTGMAAGSGIYFLRGILDGKVATAKAILLR